MSKWLFALIQFFPLSLFATYAFWHGAPSDDRWIEAFKLGAIAGIIQLAIVFAQPRPVNRLILGGNIYLIAGGLAALSHQWWLLRAYGFLQESAIFLCILLVGMTATFVTPAGFVAVAGAAPNRTRLASYWLILATLLALLAALAFRGNQTWAAVVPIVFLTVLQRVLAHRLRIPATAV